MKSFTRVLFVIALIFSFCGAAAADTASDPARDPFYTAGKSVALNVTPVYEHVDPFSGILTIVHNDLTLPGNGGLDLKIMRTYSSAIWGRRDTGSPGLVARNDRSPIGIGWSMHQGIVLNPYGSGSSDKLNPDNPVVEMPDGSRHALYKDRNDASQFISRDLWIYKSTGNGIWKLTLADGTVYNFEYSRKVGYNTGDGVKVAQVTSIGNPAGTASIKMSYDRLANGYSCLKTITDSVGRTVNFDYDYTTSTLTSMSSDTTTVSYNYERLGTTEFLNKVSLPVGNPWQYKYYSSTNTWQLQTITFPTGGTISYGYGDVAFDTGAISVSFNVVNQRTTGGRDIVPGTWTYQYKPGGSSDDTTTITGPDGLKEIHKFSGWGNCPNQGQCASLWKMGLPVSKEVQLGNSTISLQTFTWSKGTSISYNDIANANWSGTGGWVYDNEIYLPFLSSTGISRDGKTYTTSYDSYDKYGNPGGVNESGDQTRKTAKTYWSNTSKNIVLGKPSSETVSGDFTGSFKTAWTYDSDGNIAELNKYGVTTKYAYGSDGNLRSVTDANNNTTTCEWSKGTVSKITNPVYSITRSINADGTIASETNGRGFVTSFTYDKNKRLTKVAPPAGNPTVYTYPSDNSYKKEERGGYYVFHYNDGFGRSSGIDDSAGVSTDVTYKSYGVMNYESSNIGDTVYYDYFGRITVSVHLDNAKIAYTYSGSSVTVKDEGSNSTSLTYKAFGNPDEKYLVAVNDALGNGTSYTRNILGNLTGVTQGGVTRSFAYDSKGFLKSESHTESGDTTYSRDSAGNITSRVTALGTTSYAYDKLNRLAQIRFSNETQSFGYDNADNRISISSSAASISYTYDSANRLTQKSETIAGKTYKTGYDYDGNDNVTQLTYPSGMKIASAYDSNNRLAGVSGFGGGISSINYNKASLPTSFSYVNGIATAVTYNNRNLATQITAGTATGKNITQKPGGWEPPKGSTPAVTNVTAVKVSYDYDSRGNTTSITNALDSKTKQSLTYDNLNRLAGFNGAWGSGSFTYDATGNRLSKKIASSTTSYSYSGNRLTSTSAPETAAFKYNSYGSLAGGTWNNGTYSLTYDTLNNLLTIKNGSAVVSEYKYDADGMRVSKTSGGSTVVYHYDNFGRTLSETTATGALIAEYVYANGKLAAVVKPDGVYYYHTDPAGSPIAMTNKSNTVVWKADYRPFGEEQSKTLNFSNDRMFAGKERDRETGMYYFGARYMRPENGRFTAIDPIGPVDARTGKVNDKMLVNPQRLNRYAYALNNPYRYVDPDGNWPEDVHSGNGRNAGTGSRPVVSSALPRVYWQYSQSTGVISNVNSETGVTINVGAGYSGNGAGLNNPDMQKEPFIGPIPQGIYSIGKATTTKGPLTLPLTPKQGTNTYGRDAFRIHGDNIRRNQSASEGCIITGRNVRNQINHSQYRELRVIP